MVVNVAFGLPPLATTIESVHLWKDWLSFDTFTESDGNWTFATSLTHKCYSIALLREDNALIHNQWPAV